MECLGGWFLGSVTYQNLQIHRFSISSYKVGRCWHLTCAHPPLCDPSSHLQVTCNTQRGVIAVREPAASCSQFRPPFWNSLESLFEYAFLIHRWLYERVQRACSTCLINTDSLSMGLHSILSGPPPPPTAGQGLSFCLVRTQARPGYHRGRRRPGRPVVTLHVWTPLSTTDSAKAYSGRQGSTLGAEGRTHGGICARGPGSAVGGTTGGLPQGPHEHSHSLHSGPGCAEM